MQYQIATSDSISGIQQKVDELMADEWKLVGGVSTYVVDGVAWFAQAMVKDNRPIYSAGAL